jgi:hypothetical protein
MKSTLFGLGLLFISNQAFASDFYDQFIFEIKGLCSDNTLEFVSVYSFDEAILGKDEHGNPMFAVLGIQLFKDHTYWASYGETVVYPGDLDAEDHLFDTQIAGSWNVNEHQITLSDLGFGTPAANNPKAFQFQITKKLNDPRAVNAPMVISRAWSDVGPKGIAYDDYCGNHSK